jgi:hypothetical protein
MNDSRVSIESFDGPEIARRHGDAIADNEIDSRSSYRFAPSRGVGDKTLPSIARHIFFLTGGNHTDRFFLLYVFLEISA